ncbi:MAG: BamA/TamA family outer membrane protein [Polyangiales bacterium]
MASPDSFRLTFTWDNRDNRMFTKNGQYASYSVQVSDRKIGSAASFVRQTAFARFYKKIFGPFVLKLNTELGLITSRDSTGVPNFERFYLGGIYTIRGYPLQSVGPQTGVPSSVDPNAPIGEGVPFGGNMQGFYNLELEFPIVESIGIRGVVFQDAGNAWNLEFHPGGQCQLPPTISNDRAAQPCGLHPFLRASWGFGLRWFSPLGPLRFEWGVPIRRRPDENRIRFEFTIGNSF